MFSALNAWSLALFTTWHVVKVMEETELNSVSTTISACASDLFNGTNREDRQCDQLQLVNQLPICQRLKSWPIFDHVDDNISNYIQQSKFKFFCVYKDFSGLKAINERRRVY